MPFQYALVQIGALIIQFIVYVTVISKHILDRSLDIKSYAKHNVLCSWLLAIFFFQIGIFYQTFIFIILILKSQLKFTKIDLYLYKIYKSEKKIILTFNINSVTVFINIPTKITFPWFPPKINSKRYKCSSFQL